MLKTFFCGQPAQKKYGGSNLDKQILYWQFDSCINDQFAITFASNMTSVRDIVIN